MEAGIQGIPTKILFDLHLIERLRVLAVYDRVTRSLVQRHRVSEWYIACENLLSGKCPGRVRNWDYARFHGGQLGGLDLPN